MVFPKQKLKPDTLRELAFGSVAAGYTNIGTALTVPLNICFVSNTTDKDVYVSWDGVTNHMRIKNGETRQIPAVANGMLGFGSFIPVGTQFATKQTSAGAPTLGAVVVEGYYT